MLTVTAAGEDVGRVLTGGEEAGGLKALTDGIHLLNGLASHLAGLFGSFGDTTEGEFSAGGENVIELTGFDGAAHVIFLLFGYLREVFPSMFKKIADRDGK